MKLRPTLIILFIGLGALTIGGVVLRSNENTMYEFQKICTGEYQLIVRYDEGKAVLECNLLIN